MGKKTLLALSIYVVGLFSGFIILGALPSITLLQIALPFILFGSGFSMGYIAKSYWKRRYAKETKPLVQETDEVKIPDYLPEDI